MRKTMAATAALGMAVLGSMAAAGADPAQAGQVTITCGSSTSTYAVSGNGEFTPAHDLEGNSILVPTAFDGFAGVITDANGDVVDSFTDPGSVAKGNAQARGREILHCTFEAVESFVATADDAPLVEGDTYTFTGSGGVTGFRTGKP